MVTLLALDQATVIAGDRPILDQLTLEVGEGQMVAIIGPNGSGKSTLLRALLGLVALDSGSVQIEGRPLTDLTARQRAASMAWLPQDSLPAERLRVEDVVASARFRFSESRQDGIEAAHRALEDAGAASLVDRWINELSGGERQRIELASMLAQESKCWLLDEPANHLDPVWRARTLKFLSKRLEQGNTVLVVLHDVHLLGHIDAVETRVVGLREGKIAWQGRLGDGDLGEGLKRVHGIPFERAVAGDREYWIPGEEPVE
ncbi:MAG: ABC transporter ATP-binding protein [Planctomycetota bacterium]|nr:ABC transporter ATP-binding protein [Planctomycetota bacterium]